MVGRRVTVYARPSLCRHVTRPCGRHPRPTLIGTMSNRRRRDESPERRRLGSHPRIPFQRHSSESRYKTDLDRQREERRRREREQRERERERERDRQRERHRERQRGRDKEHEEEMERARQEREELERELELERKRRAKAQQMAEATQRRGKKKGRPAEPTLPEELTCAAEHKDPKDVLETCPWCAVVRSMRVKVHGHHVDRRVGPSIKAVKVLTDLSRVARRDNEGRLPPSIEKARLAYMKEVRATDKDWDVARQRVHITDTLSESLAATEAEVAATREKLAETSQKESSLQLELEEARQRCQVLEEEAKARAKSLTEAQTERKEAQQMTRDLTSKVMDTEHRLSVMAAHNARLKDTAELAGARAAEIIHLTSTIEHLRQRGAGSGAVAPRPTRDEGITAEAREALRKCVCVRVHQSVASFKYNNLKNGRIDARLFTELFSKYAIKTVLKACHTTDLSNPPAEPLHLKGETILILGGKGTTAFKHTSHGMFDTSVPPNPEEQGAITVVGLMHEPWICTRETMTVPMGTHDLVDHTFPFVAGTNEWTYALQGPIVYPPNQAAVTWVNPGRESIFSASGMPDEHVDCVIKALRSWPKYEGPEDEAHCYCPILADAPDRVLASIAGSYVAPQLGEVIWKGLTSWMAVPYRYRILMVTAAMQSVLSPDAIDLWHPWGKELTSDGEVVSHHPPTGETAHGTSQTQLSRLQSMYERGDYKEDAATKTKAEAECALWHSYYRVNPRPLQDCVKFLLSVATGIDVTNHATRLAQARVESEEPTPIDVVALKIADSQPLHCEVKQLPQYPSETWDRGYTLLDRMHFFQALCIEADEERATRARTPFGRCPTTIVKRPTQLPRFDHPVNEDTLPRLRSIDYDFRLLENQPGQTAPAGTVGLATSYVIHGGRAPLTPGAHRLVLQFANETEYGQVFAWTLANWDSEHASDSVVVDRMGQDLRWRDRGFNSSTIDKQMEAEADVRAKRIMKEKEATQQLRQGVYVGLVTGLTPDGKSETETARDGGVALSFIQPGLLSMMRRSVDAVRDPGLWDLTGDRTSASVRIRTAGPARWTFPSSGEARPDPTWTAFVHIFKTVNPRLCNLLASAPQPYNTMFKDGRLPFGHVQLHAYGSNHTLPDYKAVANCPIALDVMLGTRRRDYRVSTDNSTYGGHQLGGSVRIHTASVLRHKEAHVVEGPARTGEQLKTWADTNLVAKFRPTWTREEEPWILKIQTLLSMSPEQLEDAEATLTTRWGTPPDRPANDALWLARTWTCYGEAHARFNDKLAQLLANGLNVPTEAEVRMWMATNQMPDLPEAQGQGRRKIPHKAPQKRAAIRRRATSSSSSSSSSPIVLT